MYVFISIVILLASVFLVFIVLVQNSKGGGLAAGFSSSNQVLGVRKTTDFLEKATWVAAGVVVILCISITAFIPREGAENQDSEVLPNISLPVQQAAPDFGTTTPLPTGEATQQPEAPTE
ncbi:MAG: preprotein translocase subunit SecG [Tannerella sp.]|jgi:preprotein translocase subunit SecG|nr:preprotein translocase subunit SecG [Tannerella sp.]